MCVVNHEEVLKDDRIKLGYVKSKKAKMLHGYRASFLKKKMIAKLEKPVKLIRCGFDNNVTFGVTDVHRMDRQFLCQRAAAVVTAFAEAA